MSNTTLNIAPYMKYYVGQKCKHPDAHNTYIIEAYQSDPSEAYLLKGLDNLGGGWTNTIIPILRSLKSMTDDEKVELYDFMWPGEISVAKVLPLKYLYRIVDNIITTRLYNPKIFHWLISKGFWLFGDEYFDAGLILELQQKVK